MGCSFTFIASIVGLLVGGMPGLLLGLLLGTFLDRLSPQGKKNAINQQILRAITALSVTIMKADHKIMKSELNLFRDFMVGSFGHQAASVAIDMLRELKDEKISIIAECQTLNQTLNYGEKLQILRYFFQLASIDGSLNSNELSVLEYIGRYLNISQQDFVYIKSTYFYYSNSSRNQQSDSYQRPSTANDYAILGVKPTDSDETIKQAFRRLAIETHPDKVEHLGETARKEAEQRFKKVNEAYQRIKKQRNIT